MINNRRMRWSCVKYMGCEAVATKGSIDYVRRVGVMTLGVYDLPQIAGTSEFTILVSF
jgi:hypothetical protein